MDQEQLLIVDALDIKIEAGEFSDARKLNFTWEMLGFTEEWIQIQLNFENPNRVSQYLDFDTLIVSFWGVDWFSSSDGEPVRYGTQLQMPVLQQIDPERAESLRVGSQILVTLAVILILLSTLVTGRLMPTWMFLNSLQLVSHLPLFKTEATAAATYFIYLFQDLAKLDVFAPAFKNFAVKHGYLSEGALNVIFKAYGYPSMYMAGNMPSILITAACIFAIWALTALKGYCVQRYYQKSSDRTLSRFLVRNHGHWMVNFSVRFLYEVFMVICLSALISLQKDSQQDALTPLRNKHDHDSDQAVFDRVLAVFVIILVAVSILYACYRVVKRCVEPADLSDCFAKCSKKKKDQRSESKGNLMLEDS